MVCPIRFDAGHLDVDKSGGGQLLDGQLLAPGGAEAFAAVGQRDGHAVHGGGGVEERRHRHVEVVLEVGVAVAVGIDNPIAADDGIGESSDRLVVGYRTYRG